MKKYIQPTAETVNYTLEGTIAMSIVDNQPTNNGDGDNNQFSNFRETNEDWED